MRSAAILAGGRATRFGGQDKSALVVDGRAILDRQIDTLRGVPRLSEILLVGASGTRAAARAIPDIVPGCGPLGGIHAALSALPESGGAMFVLACDMPYVSAPLVDYMFTLAQDADAVVPETERGRHPLCAVYTRACLDAVAARLAERRLKVADVIEDVRARIVGVDEIERFGDRHRLLANVNTPGEFAALHRHQL